MSFTNESKPGAGVDTKLNVGSGFSLLVGGLYKLITGANDGGMTNIFKNFKERWNTWTLAWDSNTVHSWDDLQGEIQTNIAKVSIGETWATISTTWASETRDWLSASQLITNVKMDTDTVWSNRTFVWQLTAPWQQS